MVLGHRDSDGRTFPADMGASDWFSLPLSLRQRWWVETDYGGMPPTEELKQAMKDTLNGVGT